MLARSVLANGLLTGKYGTNSTFPDGRSPVAPRGGLAPVRDHARSTRCADRADNDLALRDLALAYALTDSRLAMCRDGRADPAQLAENLAGAAPHRSATT